MIDFAHSYELRHASLDQGARYSESAIRFIEIAIQGVTDSSLVNPCVLNSLREN